MRFKSITRLGYWQGQELRSRDLRDQTGSLQQLRWWHNRAAHQVFGVSQGLSVTVDAATPAVAKVGCGLAYDCFGRELILPADTTIEVPSSPVSGAVYLTISYGPRAAGLSFIGWQDFSASRGVPLSRFDPGAPFKQDESFKAPAARALSRPRLGGGSTVPGNTPWEKLPGDSGLQVVIDTSGAGFTAPPFYLASLTWQKLNTQFTAPIANITEKSKDDFTLQLLLKDVGRELFGVVTGAGLVNTVDNAGVAVTFRQKVQFPAGQDFQPNDLLARLNPLADLAVPISKVTGQVLTLGATSSDWHQQQNDVVVLGSVPASATVSVVLQALIVADPSGFSAGSVAFRMAGTTAGVAAEVQSKTADGTLLLSTALAGLVQGEPIGSVTAIGKVTLKNAAGTKLAFVESTAGLANAIVIRLSDQMDKETPTTVKKVNADGSIDLVAAIGLKDGDTLGVAKSATSVNSFSTALAVDNTTHFQVSDLIGVGATPQSNFAILRAIDGSNLILASTIIAVPGAAVVNADFPARSTVLGDFNPQAFAVRDTSVFVGSAVMVHLKGAQVLEAGAILNVFPAFQVVIASSPMPTVATGEVLAIARFARTAKVNDAGTGPAPRTVQLDRPAAGLFRVGDTVAKMNDSGPLTLAVVRQVAGSSITLASVITELGVGDTIGVVAWNAAVIVSDPPPDATHLKVDQAKYARVGGVLGRLTGWVDASSPVLLKAIGAETQLSILPDGLMAGDALGFAALAPPGQRQIRFDPTARVASQMLRVQGPEENTGSPIDSEASVTSGSAQPSTLQFAAGVSFAVRPEAVQITGSSQIDDFLAYAQKQGLSVCWLGCQMPLHLDPGCLGNIPVPCPCK